MTPLAALAIAGCVSLGTSSDRVLLQDLAPAFEDVTGASPDAVIALAPGPGVERRFTIAELRRIAARLGLPEPLREVCVQLPLAPLDPARIVEAMHAQAPAANIELLDFSRQPFPEGVLEFPRTGLRQTVAGTYWNGSIQYAGRHRLSVWARLTIAVSTTRVVAAENLGPGRVLDAAMLRVETRDEFPSPESFPAAIDEVAGKLLRRPVAAGTAIRTAWLDAPKAVTRGETVTVEARAGGAVIQAPGQAQGSGAVGQTIQVLNPMSNKRFPARVEARGKVAVGKGSL